MGKRVISVGIIYAALICFYTECTELKCKLTLKTAECEFYKALLETCLNEDGKESKKKKKDE